MAELAPIKVMVNGEVAGKTIKDLQGTVAGLARELQRLPIASDAWIEKARQYDEATGNLRQARDAAKQVSDQINRLDPSSMRGLQQEAQRLGSELERLPVYSEAWIVKTRELETVKKRIQDAGKAAKEVAQAMGEAQPSALVEAGQRIGELREKYGSTREAIRQMKTEAQQLAAQMQRLPEGSAEWIEKSKGFEKITAELNQAEGAARQVARALGQAGEESRKFTLGDVASFAGTFAGVQLGVEAAASAISSFASSSVESISQFEASLSSLKAITGATAEDLEFYSEAARKIGETTTLSAIEAVEAFKLIGSAKPELLANKEALTAVTQEAIALAQASGLALPEAANALVGSLNQFGAGADQASRYINVLAAGAKEGASEITETAAALKNSGTVAAAAGLSFEATNAVLQSLSAISLKGSEAGTGLRNVLLRLQAGADDTNPKLVGLQTALDNLAQKNLSAAELTKQFGAENVVVAQRMIASRGEIERLTGAISGTQEAYKQAGDNTNNFEADMKRLKASFETLQIEVMSKMLPALELFTRATIALINGLKELPGWIYDNREALLALVVALVSLNANQIRASASTLAFTAVEKARAIATKSSAAAQWLLNAAMTANPIGLVIAAVALVVAGFVTLYKNSEMLRAGIAGLWNGIKELASMYLQFWKALATGDISGIVDMFKGAGKRIASAFSSGYDEKIKEEHQVNKRADADRAKDRAESEAKAANAATQQAVAAKVGLIKKLEEDMKALRDQLSDAATRSEIDRIRKQIVRTQAVLDELTGKAAEERAKKAKEEAEKRKKELEQRAKDELDALRKAQANERALIADETARKVADLRAAAQLEVEAAQGRRSTAETKAREIASIEAKLQRDIADTLDKGHRAAQEKAEKAAADQLRIARDKAQALADLAVLQAQEEQRLAQQRGDFAGSQAAGRQLLDAQLAQLQTQADMELQQMGLTEERKQLILAESQAKQAQMLDGYAQQQREVNAQTAAGIVNGFQQAFGTLADFQAIQSQREMQRVERDKAARLRSLNQEFAQGKISKQSYEREKAGIEQRFADETRSIKREAARREKMYNVASAIMQAAIAVIAASANPLGIFSPQAIATSAMAALNIAKVIATPVPDFAKGGLLPSRRMAAGGVISGPSHAQGGVPVVGPGGTQIAEVEGGEPILSRATYANNRQLVDMLLDTSMNRGGAALAIDTSALKAVRFETGGLLPGGATSTAPAGAEVVAELRKLSGQLASQHQAMAQVVQNVDKLMKAYVVVSEVGEELDKLRELRRDASGSARDGTAGGQDVLLDRLYSNPR